MQNDYDTLSAIQSEVLGYLEEHPNAVDTAEGIRQWWLFQRMAKCSGPKVKAALVQLKAAHLIETRRLDNGLEVYALARPDRRTVSVSKVNM